MATHAPVSPFPLLLLKKTFQYTSIWLHFSLESAGGKEAKQDGEKEKWWWEEKTGEDETKNMGRGEGQIKGRHKETDRQTNREDKRDDLKARRKRGTQKREKLPLGARIMWPLPPSREAANRRRWVPTIPVTLEVSWRKAALIKLTPRQKLTIAGSNAQNNPPQDQHHHPSLLFAFFSCNLVFSDLLLFFCFLWLFKYHCLIFFLSFSLSIIF